MLDLTGANRHGQQLFIANLFQDHTRRRSVGHIAPAAGPPAGEVPEVPTAAAAAPGQLLLPLAVRRDLAANGRTGLHLRADPARAAGLERDARELAAASGWSSHQTADTCHGIRIVLGIQDHPEGPVNASDVALLAGIDLPVWPVLEVLAAAGCLHEDRSSALDTWFTQQTNGLPEPMARELRTWFEVMKHGSRSVPRRRPRSDNTINLHLRWALPSLRAWAAQGHTSLREITKEQILDTLPAAGNPRSTTGQGLKSIFRLLKARKVLFTDPTARVKTGQHESRQPLPVDLDLLRAALSSTDRAQAAVVALIAFHGLRTGHLQRLRLTHVRDGLLHVDGRVIPLADPARRRLSAYLDARHQRWPNSTNPHLFIHLRTAGRSDPVGRRWVRLTVGPGLSPTAIREDRILNEALATAGDVRRLIDLFGLSVQAASRYAAVVDHPDLTANG